MPCSGNQGDKPCECADDTKWQDFCGTYCDEINMGPDKCVCGVCGSFGGCSDSLSCHPGWDDGGCKDLNDQRVPCLACQAPSPPSSPPPATPPEPPPSPPPPSSPPSEPPPSTPPPLPVWRQNPEFLPTSVSINHFLSTYTPRDVVHALNLVEYYDPDRIIGTPLPHEFRVDNETTLGVDPTYIERFETLTSGLHIGLNMHQKGGAWHGV